MDLNELFYRHQVSAARASSAPCPDARAAHHGVAEGYAARIVDLQRRAGTTRPFTMLPA